MADYIAQPDTAVDPDAPVTSDLMYALRDNPVAMFEGAAGAPRLTNSAIMAPVAGTTYQVGPTVSVTTPGGESRTGSPAAVPIRGGRVTFRVNSPASGGTNRVKVSIDGVDVLNTTSSGTLTAVGDILVGSRIVYTAEVPPSGGGAHTATFQMLTGNDAPICSV